jgi:hypothetical protein
MKTSSEGFVGHRGGGRFGKNNMEERNAAQRAR